MKATMMASPSGTAAEPAFRQSAGEVWLRGNMRPLVVAAVAEGLVLAAVAAAVAATGFTPLGVGVLLAVAATTSLGMAGIAMAASRPRLAYRDGMLVVRLRLRDGEELPIDLVECFFLGATDIRRPAHGGGCDGNHAAGHDHLHPPAARRRGTLVMRLAERAIDWRRRPTFTPWGTWSDGYVVFDGLWCEPLSPDFVERLTRRLVEMKRAAGSRGGAA